MKFRPLFLFVPALAVLFAACSGLRGGSGFDSDKVSPHVLDMADDIAKEGFVGTQSIGRNPAVSPTHVLRMEFIRTATVEELLEFLNHPSGVVKATAFEGLHAKGYTDLKQSLLDLSEGDDVIRYIHGDVEYFLPLVEYAYTVVLGMTLEGESPAYAPVETVPIGLSATEKAFVENRILAVRSRIPS